MKFFRRLLIFLSISIGSTFGLYWLGRLSWAVGLVISNHSSDYDPMEIWGTGIVDLLLLAIAAAAGFGLWKAFEWLIHGEN